MLTGYGKNIKKESARNVDSKRAESEAGRFIEHDTYSRTNSRSVLSKQGENFIQANNPFISRPDHGYRSHGGIKNDQNQALERNESKSEFRKNDPLASLKKGMLMSGVGGQGSVTSRTVKF